jgi:putative acyl-CoA dehydrogenase
MTAPLQTHDVDNQPPEFSGRDLWTDDIALREGVEREGATSFHDAVRGYGRLAGGELLRLSFDAHRDRPRLRTHDRFGHRLDVVEFHPNYHAVMASAIEHGVAGLSWRDDRPGRHVARAA